MENTRKMEKKNLRNRPETGVTGSKHINKSYSVERPEFWEREFEWRDLEFQNPHLKKLPYFQEMRQNFREMSDREEREPRISVAKAISMVREPPVEAQPVRVIPRHINASERSFIESVLADGPATVRYVPDRTTKPAAWKPYSYWNDEVHYFRLVRNPGSREGLPAYDRQIVTPRGIYIRRTWNYFILRYEPLITAVYLGSDRWAVINVQTGELLYRGQSDGLVPQKYFFAHGSATKSPLYIKALNEARRNLKKISQLGWEYPPDRDLSQPIPPVSPFPDVPPKPKARFRLRLKHQRRMN